MERLLNIYLAHARRSAGLGQGWGREEGKEARYDHESIVTNAVDLCTLLKMYLMHAWIRVQGHLTP